MWIYILDMDADLGGDLAVNLVVDIDVCLDINSLIYAYLNANMITNLKCLCCDF